MSVKTLTIGFLLLSTGCATIYRGSMQDIEVRSIPAGATIFLQGCGVESHGWTTPATIRVNRSSEDCRIQLSRNGYWTQTIGLSRAYAPVGGDLEYAPAGDLASISTLLLLISGSRALDYATGASFVLEPHQLEITLEPESAGSASKSSPRRIRGPRSPGGSS